MLGFDEFFMTFVESELIIEGLNHKAMYLGVQYFYSVGLPLHTARYLGGLWDSSSIILIIDDTQRAELELFESIERSFDNIMMEITVYLTIR